MNTISSCSSSLDNINLHYLTYTFAVSLNINPTPLVECCRLLSPKRKLTNAFTQNSFKPHNEKLLTKVQNGQRLHRPLFTPGNFI